MDKRILMLLWLLAVLGMALGSNVVILNPGCKQFDQAGACATCSARFYKDQQGICQPVNSNCKTYRSDNGACTSCYDGFSIVEDACLPRSQIQDLLGLYGALANCNEIGADGTCRKCSMGFYFDMSKSCKKIPDTCANFNAEAGRCQGCYQGYSLNSNNQCIVSVQAPADLGCSKFQNGKCSKCSFGYYFDASRQCRVIPPTCQYFDTVNFRCSACYPGYSLDALSNCVVSAAQIVDPGCSKFENGKCTRCSFGFYFDRRSVCKMIPASCGSFDTLKEVCNACYPGYGLDKDGTCVANLSTAAIEPGCNQFENSRCVKCSFGYYFDKKGACKLVPPTCKDYDTKREICINCYPGYSLDDSKSCVESVSVVSDLGCSKFESGRCVRCSVGYYFDKLRMCKLVPPTCSSFDPNTEQCLACYFGYALNSNKVCVVSLADNPSDLGCSRFQQGKCMACSNGYYFNEIGKCQQIPASCSNFDTMIGVCRGCYLGYELNSKNQCVTSQSGAISDLNCKQFRNGKCVACSIGSFFDAFGKCVLADPLCKNFNSMTRRCQQCYPGYSLDPIQLACLESPAATTDPNCKTFKNNECLECAFRFFKDADGVCKSVDPNCRLYNLKSGECNGCYDGYKMVGNRCETENSVSDPYCAEWKNGKCNKCALGAYFGPSGACLTVDPLCMTWSDTNGACRSCYPSFELSNGKCIVSTKNNYDPNCAKFSSKGECTQCSRGFYFNANSVCTQVDPLCASFDSKFARCLACYPGYKTSSGKCLEDIQAISDLNCAQFRGPVCVRCSQGFYSDSDSKCRAINPQCRYFDYKALKCGQCYPGYVLFGGECVVGTKNSLCAEWKEGICLRCVHRAYFNEQGGCNQVSEYCNTYDVFDGTCLSCYGGFELANGKCKRQTESNGCIEYSKDLKCLQCQKRRYLENGVCAKIDDLCQQFNFLKKSCSRCYKGYSLANNKCVVVEVKAESEIQNCFTYSVQGTCVECFDRYYLKEGTCRQVNVLCKKYKANSGECTDCYSGFRLDSGKCLRK